MRSDHHAMSVRFGARSVDQIRLGVLRVKPDGEIVYANEPASLAIGLIGKDQSLFDLDLEPESRRRVEAELASRRKKGGGSDYPIRLRSKVDGTLLELQVSAVPEYDANDEPIGSVTFVRDVTMDGVNRSIHDAMGRARDWQGLLQTLCRTLHDVIAFDSLLVVLVSSDRQSLRALYDEHPIQQAPGNVWRWWPMPPMIKADLNELKAARTDDVERMFGRSPYRELEGSDEATRTWRAQGYKHLLRRPVMHGKRLVAIVAAQRKDPRPFDHTDIARLEQLPIGEVVNMALALQREEDMRFGIALMGRLGAAAGSIASVARVLVDELRSHFDWPHVSLFRIDRDRDEVALMYQAAERGARLRPGYRQDIGIGLLGEVARTGKAVRAVDVHQHPGYKQGIRSTVSEMCVPVPGRPVRWILNAESPMSGAFAEEELAVVTPLLEVAGLILERTVALEMKNSVLESMADAVFETSSDGVISDVNGSCSRMLGRSREELIGTNLAQIISTPGNDPDPPNFAARFVAAESIKPAKLELLDRNGEAISVVMSGSSLPAEVGGHVYVATDLRFAEQVQRMDALRSVFRQVASEIRVPLSLASGFIQQVLELRLGSGARDTLDKALQQLRKADLPLERVVRLATTPETAELPRDRVELVEVAQAIREELPERQRRDVRIAIDGDDVVAGRGSLPDLQFCASGILAFFLRMKAQRDQVLLQVGRRGRQTHLSFELIDGEDKPSDTRFEERSAHEREFALAEPVIEDLMQRMKGRFEVGGASAPCIGLWLEAWEVA